MGKSLLDIAKELKDSSKKVQLIFAFNGTGKTRLSREFKELIASTDSEIDEDEDSGSKVIYYNAFTEDLFYWDNDLDEDIDRKLVIRPNGFTKWVLVDQGKENEVSKHFQRYTSRKLSPLFNSNFTEVRFSIETGDEQSIKNIKISKGEESNFIWCIFYSILEEIVEELNDGVDNDDTDLQYVFIDDPVSSLDENHIIELAEDISSLIKSSKSDLKFIITTHNPLFYNVLHNNLNIKVKKNGKDENLCIKQILKKNQNYDFSLVKQKTDSPFSYHLYLKEEIENAIKNGTLSKYHFNFLRNILEKTATFLGYQHWSKLLPKENLERNYLERTINLSSHSKHSYDEIYFLTEEDKEDLKFLMENIEIFKLYNKSNR